MRVELWSLEPKRLIGTLTLDENGAVVFPPELEKYRGRSIRIGHDPPIPPTDGAGWLRAFARTYRGSFATTARLVDDD